MWLAPALPPLFLASIVALALAGAETPARIRTLTHASWEELQFDRRCRKLERIGFSTVGVALILSVIVAMQFLGGFN